MSKPICTIMIGLPGLGKSTIVNFSLGIYDRIEMPVFVYSTDNYIENIAKMLGLTYNDVFAETIKEATEMCNDGLDNAVAEGLDIVWDQTNLAIKKRKKIIDRMKKAGYQVRGECLMPPKTDEDMTEWNHRLVNRPGKTIPNHVIANMMESFVEPTIEEGFDMITFYDMYGGLLGIDYGEN